METHGCTFTAADKSVLACSGKLRGGAYNIPGNVSSQFISGLLFALPLAEKDSVIRVTGVLESRPYLDMTLDALRLFGITIEEAQLGEAMEFRVAGDQTYRSPGTAEVEGDWSNAAFWLSAGALSPGGVVCTGLNLGSRQGDKAIVKLLTELGAEVTIENNGIAVQPKKLFNIEINAADTPDLVPVLAAVASLAEGTAVIRGAGRLRYKESDRLRATAAALSGLGADIAETADGLIVRGQQTLTGGVADSYGDHRIAMAAAVLSAGCIGPVIIRGAEAVNKSYPGFFEDFKDCLGGAWERVG